MSQQAVDGAGNWGRRQRQRNFLLGGWCRRRMASLVVAASGCSVIVGGGCRLLTAVGDDIAPHRRGGTKAEVESDVCLWQRRLAAAKGNDKGGGGGGGEGCVM